MPPLKKYVFELDNIDYVPICRHAIIWYGGNQLWLPALNKSSVDTRIHNHGCATIALADLILYLAIESPQMETQLTNIALNKYGDINYDDYVTYLHQIDNQYIRTKNTIPRTGKKLAIALNHYFKSYRLKFSASWKKGLSYYDMYEAIVEMITSNIPVILSIGPNTPNKKGKFGISFYHKVNIPDPIPSSDERSNGVEKKIAGITIHPNIVRSKNKGPVKKVSLYKYASVEHNVNTHYVCVTGLVKDTLVGKVMLQVASWGMPYYISYEEYRDYIDNYSNPKVSSLLYVKKHV